jgi:hypothetical protein
MIKNSFKVAFLGIVAFALLMYMTIPNHKNSNNLSKQNDTSLNIDYIPKYVDVIAASPYIKSETLFQKGVEKYLIVLNHDSLALFKDLYKYSDKNIVLIANISNTPWLIKQLAVNGKLEEMYKESKIQLINDSNGAFINSLRLNDNTQNKYFIYKLNTDGTINKINEAYVELNILEKGVSAENLEKSLKEIAKSF